MKIILTIILINGTTHSFEFKVNEINPYLCDSLFNKYTYVHTNGFSEARNKTGIYYKSKEVFAYTCKYKTI
jgi:hypothetical protein